MSRKEWRIISVTIITICSVLGFTACDRHSWDKTSHLYEAHGHGHGDDAEHHDSASDSHAKGSEEAKHGEADAHGKDDHAPKKDEKDH